MNSRKWQFGMSAIALLSIGYLAFVPFLWRFIRLREPSALAYSWIAFLLTGAWCVYREAVGGLFIVADLFFGVGMALWVFRPYRTKVKSL